MNTVISMPQRVAAKNCDDMVSICNDLGLKTQARRYAAPMDTDTAFMNAKLTEDQFKIWQIFCPRAYRAEELESYDYDTIPVDVLRAWSKCKNEYAFDSFEIRTTEKTPHKDPILVGFFNRSAYLLARWGEESPEQMPFQKICEILRDSAREKIRQGAKNSSNNSCFLFARKARAHDIVNYFVNYCRDKYWDREKELERLGFPIFDDAFKRELLAL